MNTGKYEIDILQEGLMPLDGGAAFAGIPRSEWSELAVPDLQNRVFYGVNQLLIRAQGMNILIDSGLGNKHRQRLKAKYDKIGDSFLERELKTKNLTYADITHLVLTHLHIDHCGGASDIVKDETEAVFKNALIYIQKGEWLAANNPDEYSKKSYSVRDLLPLLETGRIRFISGNYELAQGIKLEVTGGHTFDHQMAVISDKNKTVIFPSDICPTPLHLGLDRREAFDLYPIITSQARKSLMRRAVGKNTYLAFSHSKKPVFYKIIEENDKYKAIESNP